jgi:FSR family fosmidomycin resistance protein-like MFS transporter
VGAALLGQLADASGIQLVFKVCSFLPALGLLAVLLPHTPATQRAAAKA